MVRMIFTMMFGFGLREFESGSHSMPLIDVAYMDT